MVTPRAHRHLLSALLAGNADAGGLLAAGGAVLLNTVFECVGPESVISITLTIPIPPYDPVMFTFDKLCPFTADKAPAPSDVQAVVAPGQENSQASDAAVTVSWTAASSDGGDAITGYAVRVSLVSGASFPDRIFKVQLQAASSGQLVMLLWGG